MVARVNYVHSHMSAAWWCGCGQGEGSGCFDLEADHSIYAGGTSCPSAKKPRQGRCGCSFACLAPGSRGNHLEVSMALQETGWRIGNSCQEQGGRNADSHSVQQPRGCQRESLWLHIGELWNAICFQTLAPPRLCPSVAWRFYFYLSNYQKCFL